MSLVFVTHLHTVSYLGLSQSRVRNCTPPPQVREHWPNSLHEPQFPSCFMMSGVNQMQWPLKQCCNRPRINIKSKALLIWIQSKSTECKSENNSISIPSHPHTWCHQWVVLSWSCRRRDCLGGYTTAAYMGRKCDTAGHRERLLTIKSPTTRCTQWVTDWPSMIQVNHQKTARVRLNTEDRKWKIEMRIQQ